MAAILGCSDAPGGHEPSTWSGTVDTLPNGAIHVANPAQGRWADGEVWRLVEDLRIGAVDGAGPDLFGEIMQVAFGARGEILVLESQAQEIRWFDAQGRHLRTIGRRGGGPGELAGALGLSWNAERELWVTEVGNDRYSVFDSSGVFLRSHRRGLPGLVYPWQGGFAADGRLYDVIARGGPDGTTRFVYYARNDTAAIVDSLPPLEYRPSEALQIPGFASLLGPRLTFRFDPAGSLWFGMTDEYRLYQRELSGDTLRIVTRPLVGEPVSEAEHDSMLADAARYSPESISRSQLPQVKPLFQRLVVDDVGNLWVQRSVGDDQPQTLFDVIAPDGTFLGEVRSPVPIEWLAPPDIRRDQLLGITRDELGVPHVVRLRIDRP